MNKRNPPIRRQFFKDQPPLMHGLISDLADGILNQKIDYAHYHDNLIGFMRDVLKVKNMWNKLEEISESVQNNQYTAVQSANGVGKTFTAGRLAVSWFNIYAGLCKIILSAAPPERQIKDLLWGEIKGAIRKSEEIGVELLGSTPGALSLKMHDEWWMQGFTIPMTGTKEERIARFHGHHSPNLLIILDEAHGIPPEVYEAADDCMTGGNNRMLLLSNPLSASGPFYDAVSDPKFNVIQVSAFDHPNVQTGRDIIPGAITREKTEERIEAWSRRLFDDEEPDSSTFQVPVNFDKAIAGQHRKVTMPYLSVKTLGRFPSSAENAVIPINLIQAAVERGRGVYRPPEDMESVIQADMLAGLDVADMGADSNAYIRRKGSWVSPVERWNGIDPAMTGGKVTVKARQEEVDMVIVDSSNVGASVPTHLKHNKINAIGVKFANRPTIKRIEEGNEMKVEFRMMRDQLYWGIREWLRTDPNAMLPNDPQLLQEMSVLTYDIMLNGKITVISKLKIKDMIGRSPDALDALALTFYQDKAWKKLEFVSV